MANYNNFCTTPQDQIAKAPDGPKYSTAGGVFGGDEAFPKGTSSPVVTSKIEDGAITKTPTDETRNTSA